MNRSDDLHEESRRHSFPAYHCNDPFQLRPSGLGWALGWIEVGLGDTVTVWPYAAGPIDPDLLLLNCRVSKIDEIQKHDTVNKPQAYHDLFVLFVSKAFVMKDNTIRR